MITPAQAETLSQKLIHTYLVACGCDTEEECANALMKLTSMCGLALCASVGKEDAVARLTATRDYISRATEDQYSFKGPIQ